MLRLKPARRALPGMLLALCALLAGVTTTPVAAAGPMTIPPGPLPTGDLKPVQLSYVSIDATLGAVEGGAAVEVRTRARLRNTDKQNTFQREVAFAGPPVYGVRIGTQDGGLSPAAGSGPWTLSLGRDGDAVIEGTQALRTNGPLADLEFDWGALAPWGDSLASARLTLHFPQGLDADQLLIVDPAPTGRDTLQLSWSYEEFRPAGKVRVLAIAPSYWQPVRAARQALAGGQGGAAGQLALAAALRPLAEATEMPAQPASALHAQVLAALQQAVALAPNDPQPHRELAAYLSARAGGDPALLSRAVAELKAAYDLAPADGELKQQLLAAIDALLASCRQAGDTQGILRALDVAQAVADVDSPERAAAYADLAVRLLGEGRQAEAEATIVAGFGQPALDLYARHRPHFHSVTGEVETRSGERLMRFALVPIPGMEQAAEADLGLLAEALGQAGGQVTHTAADGAFQIVVAIHFGDGESLRAAGQAVAGSLPADADPALRLVAAVTAPERVHLRASHDMRADYLAYAEAADLAPAQEALRQRLEQMRWARMEAEAPTGDPVEEARRRWALALLDGYEAGWQALVQGCRITYRVLPPEDIVAPQWALAWGEAREIAWSTQIPRPERLWPVGVGLAGAVLVLVGVVGVAQKRRRGHAMRDT